jgi:chaperonin GroES
MTTNPENQQWFTDDDVPDPQTVPEPQAWRVVVRPISPLSKTAGGIYLPDDFVDKQSYATTIGRVLRLGPTSFHREDLTDEIQVGDFVLYGKYAGMRFECEGVRLLIMNDDELLAKVPDPTTIKR